MSQPTETTIDYDWLLGSRAKSQQLLVDLERFAARTKARLPHDEIHRSVFGLLVGAAFSLWRAAFLTEAEREWPEVLGKAEEFLRRLIRDNTVTYLFEHDTSDWTVGYYLNNARFRVDAVLQRVQDPSFHALEGVQSYKTGPAVGIVEQDPKEVWDAVYAAAADTYHWLNAWGGS